MGDLCSRKTVHTLPAPVATSMHDGLFVEVVCSSTASKDGYTVPIFAVHASIFPVHVACSTCCDSSRLLVG